MAGLRLDDDEIWAFVTDAHTGIMTTLRRDGAPVTLPLWFAVVDRVIYTRTRGKKVSRVANDARASFLVESGDRWSELTAVHLSGTATVVEPDGALTAAIDAEMHRKYAAFRTPSSKMPAATARHYASGMSVIAFTPTGKVLSWDNAKLLT